MIGLQPYSFSGNVTATTRPGGRTAANTRRRPHAEEEEKEPVSLSGDDCGRLEGLIAHGHAPALHLTHARVLLKADEREDAPAWSDTKIAEALEISRSTVFRVHTRFMEEGLEAALLHRTPRRTKPAKLDVSQEAHLIALACSEPPRGSKRWSLRLLAERFVSLECAEEPISRELVRSTLKKAPLSPG